MNLNIEVLGYKIKQKVEIMTATEDQLKAAHKHCFKNIDEIANSEICGCFCCLKIFKPKEIKVWYDETNSEFVRNPESSDCTAFCPFCEIDAILASASGYSIERSFLKEMQIRWFHDFEEDFFESNKK